MASQPGLLYEWPWERLGSSKYILFLPFAVKAIHTNFFGGHETDNWSLHMLLVSLLRLLHGQAWMSLSRWQCLFGRHEIQAKGTSFKQLDREEHWDDYIILHVLVATAVHQWLPGFAGMPLVNWPGLLILALLHAGPTESVYYWAHRLLHHHYLYSRYHSHHHSSFVTEPVTGSVHPFAEHIMYTAIFAIPMLGTWLLGGNSMAVFYVYWLGFDFLNAVGHCNFEFIPSWLFDTVPGLKYLIYTPSYHSLHHSQVHTNFCLFMPLYDYMGGTVDPQSDTLHAAAWKGRKEQPDFVFLGHGTTLLSVFHLPFALPFFAAQPFSQPWYMFLLWPLALPVMLLLWLFFPPFASDKWRMRGYRMQRWVIPRLGINYFLPSEKDSINSLIDKAILDADSRGVRVISLGALNKNEGLNGGGKLFVEKHPDLRVRVVHGNTLTAAVILRSIPEGTREVFLTGATSKLGRAIALYLCKRGTRVLMLTSAKPRFEAIQEEAPKERRHLLVHRSSYKDGAHCKVWIVGKWMNAKEQRHAPAGTLFLQFGVPPIQEVRKDCTYSPLAAMRLPSDAEGIRSCEMSMPRNCIYACHAGGLVHLLEGWDHHEVGAIDPERIDITWEAALKHGLRPV